MYNGAAGKDGAPALYGNFDLDYYEIQR